MVASGLNANDAMHLNRMLPLHYRKAPHQQVPPMVRASVFFFRGSHLYYRPVG